MLSRSRGASMAAGSLACVLGACLPASAAGPAAAAQARQALRASMVRPLSVLHPMGGALRLEPGQPGAPAGFGGGAGRQLVRDLRAAWQITQGRGVTVAVISGGVDGGAVGLKGKVIQGPGFGPAKGDTKAAGTAFASAVAGAGPSSANASGTLGLAPAARILSLRVPMGKNAGDWQDAEARAIRYAVRHHAKVIFDLPVGYTDTANLASAVLYAAQHGTVVVGDEVRFRSGGYGGNDTEFPNSLPGVVNVGSVDLPGMAKPFKKSATPVNDSILLSAPGNTLTVSGPSGQGWLIFNDLSAAAWLTATVALIKAIYPQLPVWGVEDALAVSARHPPSGGYNTKVGFGLINPVGALRAAHNLMSARMSARTGAGSVAPAARLLSGRAPAPVNAIRRSPAVLAGAGGAIVVGALLLLLAVALPLRWRRRARRRAAG